MTASGTVPAGPSIGKGDLRQVLGARLVQHARDPLGVLVVAFIGTATLASGIDLIAPRAADDGAIFASIFVFGGLLALMARRTRHAVVAVVGGWLGMWLFTEYVVLPKLAADDLTQRIFAPFGVILLPLVSLLPGFLLIRGTLAMAAMGKRSGGG